MEHEYKKEADDLNSEAEAPTFDLRGRQSVRATFRLSEACIDAISILSAHLCIKQKSVFDYLMEDTKLLNEIAKELEDAQFIRSHRVQKTYVISRRSLSSLEKISSDFNTPRDALVEYSVQRLLPVIAREREKHRIRKEMLKLIGDHLQKGKMILEQTVSLLGPEDMISNRFESLMTAYQNAFTNMASFIDRGKLIEGFNEAE